MIPGLEFDLDDSHDVYPRLRETIADIKRMSASTLANYFKALVSDRQEQNQDKIVSNQRNLSAQRGLNGPEQR
jgi:hypothetical protein